MTDATPDVDTRAFVSGVILVIAVGATIWLGAPPLLFNSLAQTECAEIVASVDPKAAASARWAITLPSPQWECSANGVVVATFGWLVTQDSAATATLD